MILACPACDSRYDVTGHVLGQKFRCPCGELMTLDALPPVDGELACPACGAGVAPTASRCGRCRAELRVKACPRCLSRAFAGHKHCHACGAELVLAATAPANPDRACPRCAEALRARQVDDVVIDECSECLGVFLDEVAIKRVVIDRAQSRAEALLGALPRAVVQPVPAAGQKMYLRCPVCSTVMNRRLFAAGTGVIIDVCREHGTFFDAGELPAVIDFVMNGGLERAPTKTGEPARTSAARDAAPPVEPSALPTARLHRDGTSRGWAASALVELLASLFG